MATIKLYKIQMPLLSSFTTSFDTTVYKVALIFELTDLNIKAYSECVTDENPYYSYEDNFTAMHIIKDHLLKLISDLPEPETFIKRASKVKGHNMAKAAIEMLLWDYKAKKEKVPLYQMLYKSKNYADVGISIGMDDPALMLSNVENALKAGYKRIKVKIAHGKELSILNAIRDTYPEIPLSADANADYTLSDLDLLKSLDRFNLVYLEQPLSHDDIIDHAILKKNISTPICLDESITSYENAVKAFEIGATDIINIKPGRVGGLYNSLLIAKTAREHDGHAWVGGMLETGIGRAFNIALASTDLIDYPGDTSPNSRYFSRDIVVNPFKMENGRIYPYNEHGIGIKIDNEQLSNVTIFSEKLLEK
ncbi:MAG: o-succinylbenzoate synthase [Thermoplasmata archaeon]